MRFYYFFIFFVYTNSICAQVGIGTENPNSSSVLDINSQITSSSFGGLKLPTVTNSQRDLIPTPIPEGLLIFNSDERCLQIYNGNSMSWLCVFSLNDPPTANSVNINGIPDENEILTGNYNYTDTENDIEGASIYRWTRSDDNSGLNEMNISGANNQTYSLNMIDVSKYIKFYITPVAQSGTSPGIEVGSSFVGPINSNPLTPVTLASWDFNGFNGSETSSAASITDSNISTTLISRGAGIDPANNANRFNADNFTQPTLADAVSNNDYFQFELTPNNSIVTITNVSFDFERSNQGPTEGALRSSVDGFVSNLATFTNLGTTQSLSVPITTINNINSNVIFRFYLFGNNNANGTAGLEGNTVNDLIITGNAN